MMRSTRFLAVAAVAAALAIVGCTGSPGSNTTHATAKMLTLGVTSSPATLDANNMNWGGDSLYSQALYDTLVRSNPNGIDVEPNLATSWSYDSAKTELTLKLRNDVKFSDGTKFTAATAAANILRFRDGTSPQRQKAADVAAATAVDDTTLQIRLDHPDPAYLLYLSSAPGVQSSPAMFTAADRATHPIGSGPYLLDAKNTVIGSSYAFKRNPNYWNKKLYPYDALTIRVFTDSTSELNALRGHQVNAAYAIDNSIVSEAKRSSFGTVTSRLSTYGLWMWDRGGTLNPALKDVRVRQAINYAFNRRALLQTIGLGFGQVTEQVFSPTSPAYDPKLNSTYSYNPGKAKSLLSDAGYPNGFDLTMPSGVNLSPSQLALVQQQLADIGVRVTYQDVGTNLLPDMRGGKFAASFFRLQSDPLPSQVINFVVAPNATWNPLHYTDPKVSELITQVQAGGTADNTAAKVLNAYLVEQAWVAPFYIGDEVWLQDAQTDVTPHKDAPNPNLWNIVPR